MLFFVAGTDTVRALVAQVGGLGYFGVFMTGMFFVSTFTVAPASVVLVHLAHQFDPLLLALYGGLGAAAGDVILFRFLKDGVFRELAPLFRALSNSRFFGLLRTPYFAWLAPVMGAAIIASPFPDEVGIGLMGLSRIRLWQFVLLVFVLDTLGILTIALIARGI